MIQQSIIVPVAGVPFFGCSQDVGLSDTGLFFFLLLLFDFYPSRMFNMLTNRKHHCRLCGEVTCAAEECSNMVIVSKDTDRDQVRVCLKCIAILQRNRKKDDKQAAPNPLLRYYEEVKNSQARLDELIPKFNEEMRIFK